MLYYLMPALADLSDAFGVFNVFIYISFRTAGAVVTSLIIAFVFGPAVIRRLQLANVGQVVRANHHRQLTERHRHTQNHRENERHTIRRDAFTTES